MIALATFILGGLLVGYWWYRDVTRMTSRLRSTRQLLETEMIRHRDTARMLTKARSDLADAENGLTAELASHEITREELQRHRAREHNTFAMPRCRPVTDIHRKVVSIRKGGESA